MVGTSMGCAVIWSYIELFGESRLKQVRLLCACVWGGVCGGTPRRPLRVCCLVCSPGNDRLHGMAVRMALNCTLAQGRSLWTRRRRPLPF